MRDRTDFDVASLLRTMEADIVVDLMGFTDGARIGIFTFKSAPVQVNWLGYPGTMGAGYMDYILSDRIVIPEADRRHYSEQVVYLPASYLPNDSKRAISRAPATRLEAGLPAQGFVFSSFNDSHKITPEMFDLWMRLLKAIDGSVLWLPQGNPVAMENLRREALARGVSAERLVFAPYVLAAADHLARLSLANLFLDTLPYNAHASACDALWAGLPVLTCIGSAFPGRVAASALQAVGLPEMVTESLADYEALALRLARDARALANLKAKLAKNRNTHPLFDTARFTRHLEAAYTIMCERVRRGDRPASFAVEPHP
jgi:protein O-GlcNAc transferase